MRIDRDTVEEILGGIAGAILAVVLFVGYLWATPDQASGEADWAADEEARIVALGEGGA